MKKLFPVFVLAVAGVVVIGLSLDWFSISAAEDSANDAVNINVRIDKAKLKADAQSAGTRVQELQEMLEERLDR